MNNHDIHLTREEIDHPYANITAMIEDKRRKAEQMRKTVFAHITQSPEVLAEKLVYCVPVPLWDYGAGLERWYTVFSPYDIRKYFRTKQEAIAAALARLKEVTE